MDVHEALRPGMVRVSGAAIEKEFAQFVFSLLLEILDACLVSDTSQKPNSVIRTISCKLTYNVVGRVGHTVTDYKLGRI